MGWLRLEIRLSKVKLGGEKHRRRAHRPHRPSSSLISSRDRVLLTGGWRLRGREVEVLFFMKRNPAGKPEPKTITEKQAKEILANPPKDRREVTIGPTSKTGPDVIVNLPEPEVS